MSVVSAADQIFTPVVVLPGIEAKYRKGADGRFETSADYLPQPNYLFYRKVAGVDSVIFFSWAQNFVEEIKRLRREGKDVASYGWLQLPCYV